MKKAICMTVVVFILAFIAAMIMPRFIDNKIQDNRVYQHELNSDADSSIGTETVPEDGIIDESFVSHLPLIVIDLQGNEIPNIYAWGTDGQSRVYKEGYDETSNPYTSMHLEVIDNENMVNSLSDSPTFTNDGLIKLRGMTSRSFKKQQYGIKLMENGEELETSMLGMDADEDWVLSNSILDLSGIRNYLTMNIGGQLFKFNPDVRYCEVIIKDGDTYTYQGLYLMLEKIKMGDGHVEIDEFDENSNKLSYIVCRDRYNYTRKTLSTWASDSQLCYGYFTMVYPKDDKLSQKGQTAIENELSTIEKCIYSDDKTQFIKYEKYLDVDSFINYFIINEFFMNYDAGNNSTYYYKDGNDKLAMGPLWDYDNAMDNYSGEMSNYSYMTFMERPWFEKLIEDPIFQEKLVERYKELRKTYLNTEYLEEFIDDTYAYLGNASRRDESRWKTTYNEEHLLQLVENEDDLLIDRNTYSVTAEIQRIKDIINIHGKYMDDNLKNELGKKTNSSIRKARTKDKSWMIVVGITAFFCTVVLVNRKVRGEYR